MDGEKNGKPYKNGWFGGFPIIFGNTHIHVRVEIFMEKKTRGNFSSYIFPKVN